jgi:hypothetical protein
MARISVIRTPSNMGLILEHITAIIEALVTPHIKG